MSIQGPELPADNLQNSLDRFRMRPETIAEKLGGDYTPERIVEMIQDVEQRKELAQAIMQDVPEAVDHYPDMEALMQRLDLMSEVLPQKKTFFEKVKEKAGWALEKIKNVVTHPVVVAVLIGLLGWWAWGHYHEMLALAHGEAAEAAAGRLGTLGEGAGAINPEMGPGLLEPGSTVPPPSSLEQFSPELPSSGPSSPPPQPPAA